MAVHLVTGYAGRGHVTSAAEGLFNAGVCGLDRYVLQTGTRFAAEIMNNNLITIGAGDLVDQGRHISIPTNTTMDISVENGTQGRKRYDLIVMRYNKDAATSVESASLAIIKGAAGAPRRHHRRYFFGSAPGRYSAISGLYQRPHPRERDPALYGDRLAGRAQERTDQCNLSGGSDLHLS